MSFPFYSLLSSFSPDFLRGHQCTRHRMRASFHHESLCSRFGSPVHSTWAPLDPTYRNSALAVSETHVRFSPSLLHARTHVRRCVVFPHSRSRHAPDGAPAAFTQGRPHSAGLLATSVGISAIRSGFANLETDSRGLSILRSPDKPLLLRRPP